MKENEAKANVTVNEKGRLIAATVIGTRYTVVDITDCRIEVIFRPYDRARPYLIVARNDEIDVEIHECASEEHVYKELARLMLSYNTGRTGMSLM